MPQIKPFDLSPELPSEINDILDASHILPKTENNPNLDLASARKALNTHGAAIDDVARTIAGIMQSGDSDTGKLRASELALKVHGILSELDGKSIPQITINIHGSENKTLINLVLPTV